MIVQFVDAVTAAPVYINPTYVVSMRPDPTDPDHLTIVHISDGETVRVRGEHTVVADRLTRAAAA